MKNVCEPCELRPRFEFDCDLAIREFESVKAKAYWIGPATSEAVVVFLAQSPNSFVVDEHLAVTERTSGSNEPLCGPVRSGR